MDKEERARKALKKQGFNEKKDYLICGLPDSQDVSHMAKKALFGRLASTTLCGQPTAGFSKKPYHWIANCGCSTCRHIVAAQTPSARDLGRVQDAFDAGMTEEEIWAL